MKAKHLTISQWSKKVLSVAYKYGFNSRHISAEIMFGTFNEHTNPKIMYSAYSEEGMFSSGILNEDWKDVIQEFERVAKLAQQKNKYTCPTCGGPIQSLAHKH